MTANPASTHVDAFRTLIAERMGLHFDDAKLGALADVLRQRMDASKTARPESYLEQLATNDRDEIRILAGHLTVGETYFFRYWDHFRAFTEVVLPECERRRAGSRHLRVLSAGCASGDEAYSLAILIREHLADADAWNIEIRGLDVNRAMIEKATRGRYSAWSLREAPLDLRARYFRTDGKEYELDESIRAMVSFEERNLVDDDPLFWRDGSFDVVFCRNVLMYFTPHIMSTIVARLARVSCPGGHLFLGHAETLRGVSHEFHLCHTHGTFYYRRKESTGHEPSLPATEPRAHLLQSPLPTVDLHDSSWVDAIQRASSRIAKLATERSDVKGREASEEGSPPDLGPAVELLRQERFADAMDLLRALPVHAATDPDAQVLRAVLLTNSGQIELAAEACAQILAVDELNAGAHYLMALGREHAGDRAGAIDHDQIATYLDSHFAMPRLHLGLLARRAGDLDEARTQLHVGLGLLSGEDSSRILLFGGGFSREALVALCRSELHRCGGDS